MHVSAPVMGETCRAEHWRQTAKRDFRTSAEANTGSGLGWDAEAAQADYTPANRPDRRIGSKEVGRVPTTPLYVDLPPHDGDGDDSVGRSHLLTADLGESEPTSHLNAQDAVACTGVNEEGVNDASVWAS